LNKPKKATIYSIAREAGVSVATVSRFFNKSHLVKETTRNKLLEICSKHGYEPSKIASAITTKRTKTIALLLPSFREPPFMDLLSGAEYELSKRGYCLNIFNVRQSIERELEVASIIDNRFIDGVIFSGVYGNKKDKIFISEMLNRGIPCVMVDRIIPNIDIPYVASNDYLGGKIAAKYLIENNHKRIGIITYDRSVYIFNQRVKGFTDVLKRSNIESEFIFDVSLEFKKIEGNILSKKDEVIKSGVTAVFNTSDSIAIILMRMLLEAKLNIPSDISIIGYDNMAYSNLTHPRLSTVHHDMYEIGKSVVDILIHRLESGTYNSMKQIIDPKIVPRDSVRKL
jgi:LacI family transcriptional regulator